MKTALLYILIIGASFAGLLGVLKIGNGIKAPSNVSGEWYLNYDFLDSIKNNCISLDFAMKSPKIHIEQSGIHLKATFNDVQKTELNGKLENYKMIFSETLRAKENMKNSRGQTMKLELILDLQKQNGNDNKIPGMWLTPDCSRCKYFLFSLHKKQNKNIEEE